MGGFCSCLYINKYTAVRGFSFSCMFCLFDYIYVGVLVAHTLCFAGLSSEFKSHGGQLLINKIIK